ncbi:T9SS type A sorting domain-containing protein [Paraflavisolibacter sp. H34]|uniref:T9SS type A sorting domain-containing protein n=1 Tax=Huijunlia imazamoxiresistens TaxID=3127457 RepID=UPI0030165F2A
MKHLLPGRKLLLPALTFVFALAQMLVTPTFAQTAYRSTGANSNWSNLATWEMFDGTAWKPATAWPGQNVGTGTVTIQNGTTVRINSAVPNAIGSLEVGVKGTGKAQIKFVGDRSLTVSGDVNIVDGDFTVGNPGTNNSTLSIGGNLFVSKGSLFDMTDTSDAATVVFTKNGNASITGEGTIDLKGVTLAMGSSRNNILDVQSAITLGGGLTLTAGTFKLSSPIALKPFASAGAIGANAGFWNNGGTIDGGGNDWVVAGLLRQTAGTLNIGTGNGDNLLYEAGSQLIFEGGTTNIASRLEGSGTGPKTAFSISGNAMLNLVTQSSTTKSAYPFDLSAGSSFTMSGGTIAIKRASANSTSANGYRNLAGTHNVTGGTLLLGDATLDSSQNMSVNSSAPLYNLIINTGDSAKAFLVDHDLVVRNNLTINTDKKLTTNGLNVSVGGDWDNQGTLASAGKLTFNGSAAQTARGATNFNGTLEINNPAGVRITGNMTANALTLTRGIVSIKAGKTLKLKAAQPVGGAPFGPSKHVATLVDRSTGEVGDLRVNNIAPSGFTFPIGNGTYYLPVTLKPHVLSSFGAAAFTGLTDNGLPNGNPAPGTGENVVNAVWNVIKVPEGTDSVNMTVGWPIEVQGAAFAAFPDSKIGISQYNSAIQGWGEPSGAGVKAASSSAPGSASFAGLSSFAPFSIAEFSPTAVLPLYLTNVRGIRVAGGNQISWQNAAEEHVVRYELERSTDGQNFTTVAVLTPVKNNAGSADYQQLDAAPAGGNNYYRIKAVQEDGKVVYSAVINVDAGAPIPTISLYPNPVLGGQVNLVANNLPQGSYTLRLFSAVGQLLMSRVLPGTGGSFQQTISLQGVRSGQYILEIRGGVRWVHYVVVP